MIWKNCQQLTFKTNTVQHFPLFSSLFNLPSFYLCFFTSLPSHFLTPPHLISLLSFFLLPNLFQFSTPAFPASVYGHKFKVSFSIHSKTETWSLENNVILTERGEGSLLVSVHLPGPLMSRISTLRNGRKGFPQKGQVVLRLESSAVHPAMISSS